MDQAGLSEQMTYSALLSHDDDFSKGMTPCLPYRWKLVAFHLFGHVWINNQKTPSVLFHFFILETEDMFF